MTWYQNYLAAQTQPWARQVQKEIDNLKANFQSAEVNNTTRDDQLASSFRQLSQTTIEATQAAQAAADAAVVASTANSNALDALQDVIDLGSPGGPTVNASNITVGTLDASTVNVTNLNASNITSGTLDASTVNVTNLNASNITSGSLSADRIVGGTIDASDISGVNITGVSITGSSFTTAGTRRVDISGTQANFYDDNGTLTGRVTAGENDRAATLYAGTGVTGVFMYNGGLELQANGPVQVTGGNGLISAGPVQVNNADNLVALNVTGGITTGGSLTRTVLAGGGTTLAAVNDDGRFQRDSSSARYKTDIEDLGLTYEQILSLQPRQYRLKDEVESNPENAKTYGGFIAEELHDAGLEMFVSYSKDEQGNIQPEGVQYHHLTSALLLAVKEQHAKIESLETRLAALEG